MNKMAYAHVNVLLLPEAGNLFRIYEATKNAIS